MTFDTVDFDTPARLATSRIVGPRLAEGRIRRLPIKPVCASGRAPFGAITTFMAASVCASSTASCACLERHPVADDAIEGQAVEIGRHQAHRRQIGRRGLAADADAR